jgi:glycosyltransferase 2 family protein
MKKKILGFLQLLFGIAIILMFLRSMQQKGQLADFLVAIQTSADNWPLLAIATLCFLGCLALCNMRWIILLRAQQLYFSFGKAMKLYLIGHFFSCVIPGATNGDFLKAYYVAAEAPGRRTEAVATIFIDRIIGLVALISLSVTMMLFNLDYFLQSRETKIALFANLALLSIVIIGSLLVFRRNIFEQIPLFRRWEEKSGSGRILARIYNSFHTCITSQAILWKTFLLSLANHVLFVGAAYAIGRSLGITSLTPLDYLMVFPIINATAALPITPGGIGVRDFAAKYLLAPLGVTAAQALPLTLLIYLSTLFWSLVGGIVYLVHVLKSGGIPQAEPGPPHPSP